MPKHWIFLNEKIRQHQHQSLSTYGIGKKHSAQEWKSIFRQLVALGFLRVDAEGYGALCLNERARPILRGEENLALRREIRSNTSAKRRPAASDIAEEDMPLWHALRKCRKELADEQNVPPYVIFHDATLKEMLVHRPLTDTEMIRLSGVGDRKLERFGEAFLDVIRSHEYSGEWAG